MRWVRILITGGAGFVGSHVADLLADRGHEPLLLDNLLPEAHGRPTAPPWCGRHELVVGDVRDDQLLARLLRGVDLVCHQAAVVGHGVDPADAPRFVLHNDHGTAVLLAAMYAAGVRRLVLASSMVVYGEGRYRCPAHGVVRPKGRRPSDLADGRFEPPCPECGGELEPLLVPEEAQLEPRSTYAATKVAQEHLATAWARQTGGGVWALRYHNVYGPRMPADTPYAGVAASFRSALEAGRRPRVFEDGGQRRDFVHVDDVARANLLALEEHSAQTHVCNIASGSPATVLEMATALSKAAGGAVAPLVTGEFRLGDVRHVFASVAHAEEVLGFRAGVSMDDGMRQFATAALR